MELDELIAPLSRQAFLSDYWGRKFLHMPGTPGRFAGLMGWDDLNAILEQSRLAPPRLKLTQNGQSVDPARYLMNGMDGAPRVDSGRFVACLAQGASLVIDCIEELAPRVNLACQALQNTLKVGNYANLYAGWQQQNAFDLHWDAQDSIMLQLSGRTRWLVYPPTRIHPLADDLEHPVKPSGPPAFEGMLQDGDALYIPRGWWHIAHPLGEPSLHLTITSIPPTGINVLAWLAGRLRRHPELRANVPHPGDAKAMRGYADALRAQLLAELKPHMLESFWREWEADIRPRPHIRLPLAPYAQGRAPDDNTAVRLASANRLSFETEADGRSARFTAGGTEWVVPAGLIGALSLLSNDISVPFPALAAALDGKRPVDDLKTCLGALAGAGVVLLEPGQS